MNIAWWISPNGDIIDVKAKHINTVIEYPEKFGFNTEAIDFVYDTYNERKGQEGKARKQIMLLLFKKGWIRIRKYKNFYSVNVKRMAGKAVSYLTQWANKLLKGLSGYKEDDTYIPIKIDQENKPIKSIELKDIANKKNFMLEYQLIERNISDLKSFVDHDMIDELKTIVNKLSFKKYLEK